jgi:lysozyme family protein
MKENYERTLAFIMLHEGSKVHKVPNDRGGLTAAYGLTLSTMVTLKLDINKDGKVDEKDVKLVNKEVIDRAFRTFFWDAIKGDILPPGVDLILADVAWNSGTGKARQFMAEGFKTDIYLLTERRVKFYTYQANNVSGQSKFLKGWLNRADDALKAAEEIINA